MKTRSARSILMIFLLVPFYSYAGSSGDLYMGDYEGTFADNSECVAEVFPVSIH